MAAKDNALEVGQSRIGWLVDGLPETPLVAVKLERHPSRVEVTLPYTDGETQVYDYWFSFNTMYGDDPHRTKRRYEPPSTLSFYDAFGPVGLVGTRASGARRNLGGGTSQGSIEVAYTILGASSGPAFERINGLRSEVEGLGSWIGLRSLNAEQTFSEEGRLRSVTLRLEASPAIRAGRRLNAEFQANWRYGPGPGPDQTTISERMQIHTQMRAATPWDEHLGVHIPLRNLLRVAAWRRLHFVSHEAMSKRDPVRTVDGAAHGDQWLPVITKRTSIAVERPAELNVNDFLFAFNDIGNTGTGRWIELSHKFERGLSPLVGLLDLQGASLEAHMAQVGIGFETLGYDLLIASGSSKSRAANTTWETRVRALTSAVARVLPFSEDDFVSRLRRNYRAVKHADNPRTEGLEMHLAYLQSIQVFRTWVATRLGVPSAKLTAALNSDKLTTRIRSVQGGLQHGR